MDNATATAQPRSGRPGNRTRGAGSGWLRAFPFLVLTLMGILFLAILVAVFGMVQGEEFNPGTFERRYFRFYQIPLLRVQITPVRRDDHTESLESTIARQIRASSATDAPSRWDLVFAERTGSQPWVGDAQVLCDYLDLKNHDRTRKWEQWHDSHPQLARVLWPLVAEVAQARWYPLIPELLRLTERHTYRTEGDPQSLQTVLTDYLVLQYIAIGVDFQQLGDHRSAVQMFDRALNHRPDSAAALAGRKRSLALGPEPGPDIDP